jgi:hypothetical protein
MENPLYYSMTPHFGPKLGCQYRIGYWSNTHE